MIRSVVAVISALVVSVPVTGYAQQDGERDDETSPAHRAVGSQNGPAPPLRRAPAAAPSALRHGIAQGLEASSATEAKAVPTPPAGSYGVVAEADGAGGIFRDSDSEAEAWLGVSGYGVEAFGSVMGGYFADSDSSGYAYVGDGDYGIAAWGNTMGGYFKDGNSPSHAYAGFGDRGIEAAGNEAGGYFYDSDHSGYSFVGYGHYGIWAEGNTAGGYFKDRDHSGYALVGNMNRGIDAFGYQMGGYFKDSDSSGYANVGIGDRGIEALGNQMGGYFEDLDGSGYANIAEGDYGIRAYGNTAGGRFMDLNSSSDAYVGYQGYGIQAQGSDMGGYFADTFDSGVARAGYGDWGIEAYGNAGGGYFWDLDGSGLAYVGYGSYGIWAEGNGVGGYFEETGGTGRAYVGYGDRGIYAEGSFKGGFFNDTNSSSSASVGFDTYKIYGNGSVDFVQNHPYDHSSVIVYAAPEGDEVATYTRGSARLVDGQATVPLGETFEWVTNPDIGLTAFLTPVSEWCDLYVADQATESIVVRSRDGSDCEFNYMVYGLRIGFEETSVVQEKQMESYIPSMASHRELYERRPDLRRYNSLERFKAMRHAVGKSEHVDLSRAHALRDAIVEFDPAVHELPRPHVPDDVVGQGLPGEDVNDGRGARSRDVFGQVGSAHDEPQSEAVQPTVVSPIPVDADGNVYATSFRPSARDVASLVDVSEAVEPGDVLVIDRDSPGMMRRGFEANDTGVIGVVTADAGVVLGADSSVSRGIDAAPSHRAAVALAGVIDCKVDAGYGAIWPGDLMVTSPTPGHAMRTDAPLPGTMLGKALEPLEEGTGTIQVLVMLR